MIGTIVTPVGAQPAHATTALFDFCGAYLQGVVDPAGGLIPGGLTPAPTSVNTSGQHAYVVTGHESSGQNKIQSNLNDTTAGATRFKMNVTLGGTISGNPAATGPVAPLTGAANGTTTISALWKNDLAGRGPKNPHISVKEHGSVPSASISYGNVVGVPGDDAVGPQIGNIQHGIFVLGVAQNSKSELVTPRLASSGTFVLSMDFPSFYGLPYGGTTVSTAPIAYDANAAAIAAALNTAFALTGGGVTVTGTDFVPGTTNGDYTIEFTGYLSGNTLPSFYVDGTMTSGDLARTRLDDGSLWNAKRNGGVDPSITPFSDLGLGTYISSGVMSTGNIPIPGNTTTGSETLTPDTQYLIANYDASMVDLVAPGFGTDFPARDALQSIVGPALPVTLDHCGLLGVVAIFCSAARAQLPVTFVSICPLLL